MKPFSQMSQILGWLKRGHAITPRQALDKFECFRLGARIYDLRRKGHRIERQLVDDGRRRYARYKLARAA